MYNLIISFVLSVFITALLKLIGFSFLAAFFPALIVFIAAFIFLSRKIFRQFEFLINSVQIELQRQANIKNPNLRSIEPAVNILKSGYPLAKWQFFLKGQIDAQIGVIYYQNKKSSEALPYLENAFLRHWIARAMLASYYYKKKMYAEMDTAFQTAIKANKKTPMLYLVYAWCLNELKRVDEAKNILQSGLKSNPAHSFLEKSLIALQNQKGIKLKEYGDEWYQFRLEQHPQEVQIQKPLFKQSKKRRLVRR